MLELFPKRRRRICGPFLPPGGWVTPPHWANSVGQESAGGVRYIDTGRASV